MKRRHIVILFSVALALLLLAAGLDLYDAPASWKILALGYLIGTCVTQLVMLAERSRENA
jgi:uncharacterized protein YjeT (DUF2065 family)